MSLTEVDWKLIPAPADDGAAVHLQGMTLPDVSLRSTSGGYVRLSDLRGRTVLYVYPMTGRPDRDLPEGWNDTPGARGCTPQSCAYRDHAAELKGLGVDQLYGLSVQSSEDQKEAVERLHLPYPLLSDAEGEAAAALDLPRLEVAGQTYLKRLTMILRDAQVEKLFYPVFPPDQDAPNVLDWLRHHAED